MGARGAFQMQQNTKLKKIGAVSNSVAPFLMIFVENGSQDGGQNPIKIDQESVLLLLGIIWGDLGTFWY